MIFVALKHVLIQLLAKPIQEDQLIHVLIDNWGAKDYRLLIKEITQFSPLRNVTSLSRPRPDPSPPPPVDKRVSISAKQLQKMTGIPDKWALDPDELEIMEKVSAGASSRVYKGRLKGEDVALKVMKTNTEEDHLETFTKELEICTAVASPHVVKFHGACILPPLKMCLVMEYCSHGNLYIVLKDKAMNIGWDLFFKWAIGIVRGINKLHSWTPEIVHRDLKVCKPRKIMMLIFLSEPKPSCHG